MGMIRFGSRVDVFVPPTAKIRVKVGRLTDCGHDGARGARRDAVSTHADTDASTERRRMRAPSCCCRAGSRSRICSSGSSRSSPRRAASSTAPDCTSCSAASCDALDGRVARATGTGPVRRGARLAGRRDHVRPRAGDDHVLRGAQSRRLGLGLFPSLFVACAVIRLARFNVEQAGRAKTYFHGLPSPAAGMTLATYYWFSQTLAVQRDDTRRPDRGTSCCAS